MTDPLAGWYPDPSGTAAYRWWDGADWTENTSDSADAADPTAAAPGTDQVRAADRSSYRSGSGRLVALVLAISLVVSGGVAGFIGWRSYRSAGASSHPGSSTSADQHQRPSSSERTGPRSGASTDARSGRLDEVTRTAALGNARMVLPAEPYELVHDPVTVPKVFDAMFVAEAATRVAGGRRPATVGIGHIPAESWRADDPSGFARTALNRISEEFVGHRPSSVGKVGYQPTTIDGTGCAELTARVRYAAKTLASAVDRVRIIGCPDGSSGSVVAAVSWVPDGAPDTVTAPADHALSTFEVH